MHEISRFLQSCPRTVEDFKERFGEPRIDMVIHIKPLALSTARLVLAL